MGFAGDGVVMLDTFMRQNVAAVAQLVEMYDTGRQLFKFEGTEFPEELEEQDPGYLASIRSILVGPYRLEPILVGFLDSTYLHLQGQSSRIADWFMMPKVSCCLLPVLSL